jgi:steroid delta-isomerase-like uncharacterized protein
MTVDENVQIILRWFQEVWNDGKTETIHELLHPDAVAIGQLDDRKELRGVADFVAFVKNLRGAFPDMKLVVEDVFGAQDKVVLRWSSTMTHSGDHLGMPASGKPVRITGITIARIRDGKLIEGWDNWDQMGMLKQIGVYASPKS